MKFLVTGGAGFIGSHLAKFLLKNNHEVVIIDNLIRGTLNNISTIKDDIEFYKVDISNYNEIEAVVDSIDGIFHEAALASVPQSFKEPERYEEVNAIGSENIFKLGKKLNAKVVFASTSSVYGDQTKFPVNENASTNPLNPYGKSKLNAEKYAIEYSKMGLEVIGLRYFNVFGIGQNPDYAGVIPKFIEKLSNGLAPIIEGDGEQIRSFTFVDDVVRANILAFQSSVTNGFINIASEDMTTINELAHLMINMSKQKIEPKYVEARKGDIKKSNADITKAKELLNWKPKITLEEGLEMIFKKK